MRAVWRLPAPHPRRPFQLCASPPLPPPPLFSPPRIGSMRTPTVAPLLGSKGYSVTVAVEAQLVPGLIPQIKQLGGCDILVSTVRMIVE